MTRDVASAQGQSSPEQSELAFIYVWPRHIGLVKSLLLFFDGVVIMAAEEHLTGGAWQYTMWGDELRAYEDEQRQLQYMIDTNLITWLRPSEILDENFRKKYASAFEAVLDSGIFDSRARNYQPNVRYYPNNSMIPFTDERQDIQEWLVRPTEATARRRGRASLSSLPDSYPPLLAKLIEHDLVRVGPPDERLGRRFFKPDDDIATALFVDTSLRAIATVMISQHSRRLVGEMLDAKIYPVSSGERPLLRGVLELEDMPTKGHVVMHDLETIAPDLSLASVDDILAFRRQHLSEHRNYTRQLRDFVRELASLPDVERADLLAERSRDIRDAQSSLRRAQHAKWRQPLAFAMGALGAAWTLNSGDAVGAGLALAGALLGIDSGAGDESSAFEYLLALDGNGYIT